MADVKPASIPRRQRARATRRKIIDAARRLFADEGYASTTMDAVAAEASVAVQTVYHVFHTKAELLRDVIQVASSGQHDPPAEVEPPWMQEVLNTSDGRRVLALSVEHGIDMAARVAPLVGAINAAASTDPDFARYWDTTCTTRRNGTTQLVTVLATNGQLRPGLSAQRAADITYATSSHETILAFLSVCGWPLADVKAWFYTMLCHQLLAEEARRGDRPGSRSPTEGLSFDHLVSFS